MQTYLDGKPFAVRHVAEAVRSGQSTNKREVKKKGGFRVVPKSRYNTPKDLILQQKKRNTSSAHCRVLLGQQDKTIFVNSSNDLTV